MTPRCRVIAPAVSWAVLFAITPALVACGLSNERRSAPDLADAGSAAIVSAVPAAPPAQSPPPPGGARLAILRADGRVAVLDVGASETPGHIADAAGASVLFDAAADGRLLLGDHFQAEQHRVILIDDRGAHVLSGEDGSSPASFLPEGGVVTAGVRVRSACGGRVRAPFLRILDRDGGAPRELPGARVGFGPDGHTWLVRLPTEPGCRPAGGFDPVPAAHVLVDPSSPAAPPIPVLDVATSGVRGARGVVATVENVGAGEIGGGRCTLVVGGARHPFDCLGPAPVASPDGRWVTLSLAQGGEASLLVYRASDGALVRTIPAGRPLSTIGFGDPAVGACFSPDGEHLVLSRPDAEVTVTAPTGGTELPLGQGSCVGFSPDGRYVLLRGTGGRTTLRLVDVLTWRARPTTALDGAADALFVPRPAR